MIPVVIANFDEAHAGLGESARQKALPAEVVRLIFVDAIEIQRRLGLFGNIRDLGNLGLHFEGKFVGLNHAFDLMVQSAFLEQVMV